MTIEMCSEEMGTLIQSLISFNRYKTCVEIGVCKGTTTYFICKGAALNNGWVYAYDLWDVHGLWNQFASPSTPELVNAYLKNKNVNNFTLTKINSKTKEFKDAINNIPEIDFAFIDGCHSYGGVKNDFDVIYPRLSSCGSILFHDTLRIDGCREFIIDLRTKFYDGTFDLITWPWGNLERRVGITLLTKRCQNACDLKIDEICGSNSCPEDIYKKEADWYKKEMNVRNSM